MNWEKLFSMQQQLDHHITETHALQDINVWEEKILALLVELGEFANETRCFKFWSTKKASEREVMLEEYVDGVHFILSLGLEKDYKFSEDFQSIYESKNESITEQFNDVFAAVIQLRTGITEENYTNLFKLFLQLGQMLGFTSEDIYKAYIEKNEVNFDRQREGY